MTPSPNIEVMQEILRSIKEETLPEMRQEIRDAFSRIDEKIKKHDNDIAEIREYVTKQRGALQFAQIVLGFVGLSSLAQWISVLSQ